MKWCLIIIFYLFFVFSYYYISALFLKKRKYRAFFVILFFINFAILYNTQMKVFFWMLEELFKIDVVLMRRLNEDTLMLYFAFWVSSGIIGILSYLFVHITLKNTKVVVKENEILK